MNEIKCSNCNSTLELFPSKSVVEDEKEYDIYLCQECGMWHFVKDNKIIKRAFARPNFEEKE